jgi:hypothetical protein
MPPARPRKPASWLLFVAGTLVMLATTGSALAHQNTIGGTDGLSLLPSLQVDGASSVIAIQTPSGDTSSLSSTATLTPTVAADINRITASCGAISIIGVVYLSAPYTGQITLIVASHRPGDADFTRTGATTVVNFDGTRQAPYSVVANVVDGANAYRIEVSSASPPLNGMTTKSDTLPCTSLATATPASTATPTSTSTATPTSTSTATPTSTSTATPTSTSTATPTSTSTPSHTPTSAPSHTPTSTPPPSPTAADVAVSTETATLTPTATPASSPVPTETSTLAPAVTPVETAVPLETPLATGTPTSTPTATPSQTPTSTPTATAVVLVETAAETPPNTPGGTSAVTDTGGATPQQNLPATTVPFPPTPTVVPPAATPPPLTVSTPLPQPSPFVVQQVLGVTDPGPLPEADATPAPEADATPVPGAGTTPEEASDGTEIVQEVLASPQASPPPAVPSQPAIVVLPVTGEPPANLALIALGLLAVSVLGLRLLQLSVRRG